LLLFSFASSAQMRESTTLKIDSLKTQALQHHADTIGIKALIQMSKEYSRSYPDTAIIFLKKAAVIAKKIKSLPFLAKCNTAIGINFNNNHLSDSAIVYLQKALVFATESKNVKILADVFANTGLYYFNISQNNNALKYYYKAVEILESIKDQDKISTIYNNIANVYFILKKYEKAIEFYQKSITIALRLGDKYRIASTYNNIANVFTAMNKFDQALGYLNNSYSLALEINDLFGQALLLNNIGNIYQKKFDNTKALSYFNKSLSIKREINDLRGIANTLNKVSEVYTILGRHDDAMKSNLECYKIALQTKSYGVLYNASSDLANGYKKTGNYKEALFYFEEYARFHDSLTNENNAKAVEELTKKYETVKKESQIEGLEKDKKIGEIEIKKQLSNIRQQRIIIIISLVGIALLLLLSFLIFRTYKEKKRAHELIQIQKHLVEEKQKEILDSIHYAKRIQTALMSNEKYINKNLTRLHKN